MRERITDRIDRRTLVTTLGSATLFGLAGCLGDDEPDDEPGGGSSGGGSSDDDDDSGSEEEEVEPEPEEFDFPSGADETGAESSVVVSNARSIVDDTLRYRLEQEHAIEYERGRGDAAEMYYDVDSGLIREQRLQESVEIERWVTPERTVARSEEIDGDRSGRWISGTNYPGEESASGFHRYPLIESRLPEFLKSASLEFDEIVADDDRQYARYTGEVTSPNAIETREFASVRLSHEVESVSGGTVSMLIAESGAIHAVDYEIDCEVLQLRHDGQELRSATVVGEIRVQYDDLSSLAIADWATSPDPDQFIEFTVESLSSGHAYRMRSGPSIPGAPGRENGQFYAAAEFDGVSYVSRNTHGSEFGVGNHLHVGLTRDDELEVNNNTVRGVNAFEHADRLEIAIYLWEPGEPHVPIYYEAIHPRQ